VPKNQNCKGLGKHLRLVDLRRFLPQQIAGISHVFPAVDIDQDEVAENTFSNADSNEQATKPALRGVADLRFLICTKKPIISISEIQRRTSLSRNTIKA